MIIRHDPVYDQYVRRHRARSPYAKCLYVLMHLIPGILAYLGLYVFRETLASLGLSYRAISLLVLLTVALGWELLGTLAMLRYVERLSFRESLRFLGFNRIDLKGNLILVPVVCVVFTLVSIPFMKWLYPHLRLFLDSIPAFHMGEWHIYHIGYYSFGWPVLLLVVVANFVGEEVYFRGYLLKKIDALPVPWLISSLLFQVYHLWQVPINWPFMLLAPLIPFSLLMMWRKNIYSPILFHVFTNLVWGELTWLIARV